MHSSDLTGKLTYWTFLIILYFGQSKNDGGNVAPVLELRCGWLVMIVFRLRLCTVQYVTNSIDGLPKFRSCDNQSGTRNSYPIANLYPTATATATATKSSSHIGVSIASKSLDHTAFAGSVPRVESLRHELTSFVFICRGDFGTFPPHPL